ncbi:pimeloyl-ACP methyl ester carboxylesterase [Tamaricihabitans halophyticus]|uniref:Pimeloyl-ACP methyl ester carboxylesterase n=1 Tax=Tamaricihabitans halophyticus TaxID=1262583 RepID=A0A4R2Q817_9PSEU|nr:alpha/beta fold hydrolase [Tamaricihabitans halophyticus]TCP45093.1 pimeloyl-ACP methyl ester carboxylesterase [Tamaricihabitans halophyticus]
MTAPALVLAPGMLCDANLWDDLRGSLDSRMVDVELTASSIGGMARQILAATTEPFVLAGLSLGAIVGFEVLRLAPERVLGFCAMSTNAGAPRAQQLDQWTALDRQVAEGGFADAIESILPTMYAVPEPSAGHADRFRAMARRVGPDVFRAQLAAQATRDDALPSLRSVRAPTLVLSGGADVLCPKDFHTAIASAIPGAELRTLPGAGHLLPIERPAEVAALLGDWLHRHVRSL